AVCYAAGLAAAGLRPVVAIYSTFLQRAYDQIVHDVCLQGLPVVFALDRAGLVGEDGPTHHGVFDLSYLRHIPGIVVMAPADENEFVDMLHASLGYGRPVAIRYPRGAGAGAVVQPERRPVPLGSGRVLQEGRDVVLLAVGRGVQLAREAAEHLEAVGVAAALADGRFVKPLDGELLARLVRGCPRLVTVEDNVVQGGFGAAVLEALAEQHLQAEVEVVGIPDRFVEHGSVPQLQQALGLDGRSLAVRVLQRWPHLERGVLRVVRRGEN
ncbi:MAG: transketolase C-terminal domain-containing protein, partial [Syntrophomonadaceae bacterium]|nr:transketolase C-terminal domain-containing protein [Syntrophomonadaceae bacterium]